jgi:hypothetical protein
MTSDAQTRVPLWRSKKGKGRKKREEREEKRKEMTHV